MRIGMLADTHLGVSRYEKYNNLSNKVSTINYKAFKEAMEYLNANSDYIVLAGDLFEKPNPVIEALKVANDVFNNMNVPTLVTGGNHDFNLINENLNVHPFDMLPNKIITSYKEPRIYHNKGILIIQVPYKSLGKKASDTFDLIHNTILEYPDDYKVLSFHGYIDDGKLDYVDPDYAIPDSITDLFDLTVVGHVHLPSIVKTFISDENYKQKEIYRVVPGSIIPSTKATQNSPRPAVYVMNTETNHIHIHELKNSYRIYNYNTNDINKTLEDIINMNEEGVHLIQYNDGLNKMDEGLYKLALQNSIQIAISGVTGLYAKEVDKVDDFWSYIEKKYPNYEKEFRSIVENE